MKQEELKAKVIIVETKMLISAWRGGSTKILNFSLSHHTPQRTRRSSGVAECERQRLRAVTRAVLLVQGGARCGFPDPHQYKPTEKESVKANSFVLSLSFRP